ncbi:hypothetical protein Tco_0577630 [Tanacetum coccineum]
MKILSVVRLKVYKKLGYGYLEEIVVRRADRQEYSFKEGDFSRLRLNDIEDMLLLHVQVKLFNLPGDDIVDLTDPAELECMVGRRKVETDYRLLQRTTPPCYAQNVFKYQSTYEEGAFMKDETVENIRVILHSIHNDDVNPSAPTSNKHCVMPLEGIHIDDKLQFMEEPVEIMEREIKRLKRSRIPLVKVRWNSRRGPEFTWEREDSFKQKYPQLFTNRASSSTTRS